MTERPMGLAWLLGLGGLLPFLLCAVVIMLHPLWAVGATRALIAYGAVILSFLGAVHWGFALSEGIAPVAGLVGGAGQRSRLVFGVAPALLAWVALLCVMLLGAAKLALLLLIAGFFATVVAETVGRGRGLVAGDYLAMRWSISVIVLFVLVSVFLLDLIGMRLG
ncbi:MAG: DUF3429 domain-containing protein [Rhodospirillales bacterium 20-60-12]|nr:MAG: DUF3429 domain-containing protein [Rhodospirillales bacterium 20-60-12]HQT66531.1 DUF3429 domain-containing protein [Acetobacteraceae bacterium]